MDSLNSRTTTRWSPIAISIHSLCWCSIQEDWPCSPKPKTSGVTLRRGWPCSPKPELHHLFFVDDSLFFIQRSVENARMLKSIIMEYCRASGQRININKSTLTVNRGANENTVSAIVMELHIPIATDLGKYLALPSMWSWSKKATLGYLKSLIQEKLQGWRSKLWIMQVRKILLRLS